MVDKNINRPEDLQHEDRARLLIDMLHRTIFHYVLWFKEVEHQFGMAKALDLLKTALDQSYTIQMNRLSKVFGFEMENNIPKALLALPDDELLQIMEEFGKNWLANDGVWFQVVEQRYGMNDAKRCNDSCWAKFSPFEAWSIKQFLGLPEQSGLEGLKKALRFRMYASINKQSIIDDGPNAIIFQMNDCRVQSARKRKALADYPCKSAGLVEYSRFAEGIDSRIKTECIGCPPDEHPDHWFCAWRFSLEE
ncbi:MAG: DUF6125 family protein [Syntrophomonadaceae bacterium]